MGFLMRTVQRAALKKQEKELGEYVRRLAAMDGDEIGMVLAVATSWRHALQADGLDVMNPIITVQLDPAAGLKLSRFTKSIQKAGRYHDSAGLMVWLHTVRTAYQPDLRTSARAMWGELRRGMRHVEEGALRYTSMTGATLDVEGSDEFPDGLTPEPL